MKAENIAVLLLAKQALQTQVKPKSDVKFGTPVPKSERVVVAVVDAGRDDWMRFKRECVLLKGGKSR